MKKAFLILAVLLLCLTACKGPGSSVNIGTMTLTIPQGWEYETRQGTNSQGYCIVFWPEDHPEGKLLLWHYQAFSVCGTDLTQEEITVGNHKARKSTYGNKWMWDFISFADTSDPYVVQHEGAGVWWAEKGEEALRILATLEIAE